MKDYRLQKLCAALVVVIAVDQISKYFATNIQLNMGISFGFFSGPILTLFLCVVLAYIAYSYGQIFFALSPIVTGIFFGASFSNILDRLIYGGVRDFLPVPIVSVRNNLADWGIILSLLWIFWNLNKASSSKTTHSS